MHYLPKVANLPCDSLDLKSYTINQLADITGLQGRELMTYLGQHNIQPHSRQGGHIMYQLPNNHPIVSSQHTEGAKTYKRKTTQNQNVNNNINFDSSFVSVIAQSIPLEQYNTLLYALMGVTALLLISLTTNAYFIFH